MPADPRPRVAPGVPDAPDAPSGSSFAPAVSVCVITHAGRLSVFPGFLERLRPVLDAYPGPVELVIGNNGGAEARPALETAVADAGFPPGLSVTIADSPRNDIATGRNLAIDTASRPLVAFIDDDERPDLDWLARLVEARAATGAEAVAGPVIPHFPPGTAHWVRHMDLHNAAGRRDLDEMPFAPSGNFLMERELAARVRFDESFGKRGGSDTDFFLRARARGARIVWAAKAAVHEDVTPAQASVRATVRRCLLQGSNYRSILEANGMIGSPAAFTARAVLFFVVSLPLGAALALVRHRAAGDWLKRAFSNLGKVWRPNELLYG